MLKPILLLPDDEAVRKALAKVAGSADIVGAPRIRSFLEFVVHQTLAGKSEDLKESVVGVEIFGKEPGWDSSHDSTVRTTANRVRKKLQDYYAKDGLEDAVIIDLEGGTYVPKFRFRPTPLDLPVPKHTRKDRSLQLACALILSSIVAGVLYVELSSNPLPTVTSYVPITSDGRPKTGPVLADGRRVYFQEQIGEKWFPVAIADRGGPVNKVDVPVKSPRLLSWSDESRSFLILSGVPEGNGGLWEWDEGKIPVKMSDQATILAAQAVSGAVAISRGRTQATVLQLGKPPRVINFQGNVNWLSWSRASNLLRVTTHDPRAETFSFWDVPLPSGKPSRVLGYPSDACCGTWLPKGDLFLYTAQGISRADIWASREPQSIFPRKVRPFPLTNGPLRFTSFTPSVDGKRIFAIGATTAAELVQYDFDAEAFVPYLHGLKGYEVDYSRKQDWLAYVAYPDKTLWKMRVDGTQNTQLTFPPLQAIQPHWSPKGDQIAFMGITPDGQRRIYLVSANGGPPVRPLESSTDQGVPTWSADATKIVFGELLLRKAEKDMTVQILDLGSHKVSTVLDSKGIWTPRWSPSGLLIAGMTPDFGKLLLFDVRTQKWKTVVEMPSIDDPTWTSDSAYIYFRAQDTSGLPGDDGQLLAIYRFNVASGKTERVAGIRDIPFPANGEMWLGLTPDRHPLILRALQTQELYELKLKM